MSLLPSVALLSFSLRVMGLLQGMRSVLFSRLGGRKRRLI